MNMLIGVICEIVSTTKKDEEEAMLMQKEVIAIQDGLLAPLKGFPSF